MTHEIISPVSGRFTSLQDSAKGVLKLPEVRYNVNQSQTHQKKSNSGMPDVHQFRQEKSAKQGGNKEIIRIHSPGSHTFTGFVRSAANKRNKTAFSLISDSKGSRRDIEEFINNLASEGQE